MFCVVRKKCEWMIVAIAYSNQFGPLKSDNNNQKITLTDDVFGMLFDN